MKKITPLLFTFFLTLHFSYAQQTISFEASEGFTLGDINTQNGWSITSCGLGCFIDNQLVSDEMSTDGNYSLKIDYDGTFGGQSSPVMGGFYNYTVPIPYATAIFSADMYMSELGGANFRFGTINYTAGSYTLIVEFDYQGNIWVVDNGVFVDTGVSWSAMTWYNVRLETTGNTVKYFIDDVEIYAGTLIVNEDVDEVAFVHDNYGGYAYIDNFRTNDEALSIVDNKVSQIGASPNPVKDIINIDTNLKIDDVSIFNQLGQSVMQVKGEQIFNNKIDLTWLANGLYIMNIKAEDKFQSFKIIKE